MFKLQITTHSGLDDIVEVVDYDPVALETKRNDNTIQAIAIGQNVYSRIDLKNVILVPQIPAP